MNRLALHIEAMPPRQTRYTVWLRMGQQFAHVSNTCTLAAAIIQAQRMSPNRGYITNHGEMP
jgi:hypothetical protein